MRANVQDGAIQGHLHYSCYYYNVLIRVRYSDMCRCRLSLFLCRSLSWKQLSFTSKLFHIFYICVCERESCQSSRWVLGSLMALYPQWTLIPISYEQLYPITPRVHNMNSSQRSALWDWWACGMFSFMFFWDGYKTPKTFELGQYLDLSDYVRYRCSGCSCLWWGT